MRILMFNRAAFASGGGMNRLVADTARRLRAAGNDVALVHRREGGHFEGTGYLYDDLDRRVVPHDRKALRLEAILEDFAPDVVQLHGVGNTLLDRWLDSRVPVARFVHNHDLYCTGRQLTLRCPSSVCDRPHGRTCLAMNVVRGCGSWNPVANLMRYRAVEQNISALRSSRCLQVMSGSLASRLVANGVPCDRICVLPPYAPEPTEGRRASSTSVRSVLHVGGLLGHKGAWMLVRMVDELPPDVQLVFAGGGRDRAMIEAHVRRRGLGSRVRIVGEPTTAQWSLLYREATLVAMPVLWNEPLGLDGLAATAYGKPVVAFLTDGIRTWLRDGETGVGVPFGQRGAFRAAVRELLDDPARLRSLGGRAREVWKENFMPQAHMAALLACYEKLKGVDE